MHVNISSTSNHPNSRNVHARHAKANPTSSNCAHCQENWKACQCELHPITDKKHLTNKHAVRSNRKHDTLVIMNAEGTPQLAHCTPQLALRLRKACLHNQQPILHSPTCTTQLAHPNLHTQLAGTSPTCTPQPCTPQLCFSSHAQQAPKASEFPRLDDCNVSTP